MQEQEAVLPIGSIIRDHYVVESLLSKRSGDPVYLVRERWGKQDRFVLKERIDLDKQERDRFVFEGVVLKQLYHPALQRVYRVFEENSQQRAYMLMQYISGPNLETMRRQWPNQSFSLPLMLSIMTPVIDAIMYLHSQSDPIIHRDINPSNIIVPESKRAVLVNCSIDRRFGPDKIASAAFQCSPGYGAPEQYQGEADPRTDLYALAATFYTILTGVVPPDARNRIAQLGSRGVDLLVRADEVMPFIPPVVGEAIHRAMSMSSDERFSSVAEFWQALQASSSSLSIENIEPVLSDKSIEELKLVPAEEPPVISNQSAEKLKEQAQRGAPESSAQQTPVRTSATTPNQSMVRGAMRGAINQTPTGNTRLLSPRFTRPSRKPETVLLLVFVLALLLSIGEILWSRTVGSHSPGTATSSPVAGHKATPISAQLEPTVAPTAEGVYKGTIHDILANTSASMSLEGIQLRPGDISGHLLIGNGLRGSGPFKGTVDIARHIQFVVMNGAGHAIFSFEGNVQPEGNIAGSYCALNQNAQCSGDYGLWSVASA